MKISFNGVIAPYTFHCPQAVYFRQVLKIFLKRTEEHDAQEELVKSAQQLGIENHDGVSEYVQGIAEEFAHVTDLVEQYRELIAEKNPAIETYVEKEFYFTHDTFERISAEQARKLEHCIYIRPDLVVWNSETGVLTVVDWKFGSIDYGQVKHYAETGFFASMLAFIFPDADQFELVIHFPKSDYSLPTKVLSRIDIGLQQLRFENVIDLVLSGRFEPNPNRIRCKLCDYRAEDMGGTGTCEDSSV